MYSKLHSRDIDNVIAAVIGIMSFSNLKYMFLNKSGEMFPSLFICIPLFLLSRIFFAT